MNGSKSLEWGIPWPTAIYFHLSGFFAKEVTANGAAKNPWLTIGPRFVAVSGSGRTFTAGAGRTDKKVRSTHGSIGTGSCSWDVYVKDGIIISELQNVNYPSCGAGFPDHEPRGCPRGATYSWYTYSPLRLKYPYIRSNLLEMWREALKSQPSKGVWSPGPEEPRQDPVAAWQSIVEDPSKRRAYQQARGKGGLVRVSHEEAATLIAAALVYTIKKYGPDRVFGFTPIPAMSMVGYSSGARFVSLIGGSMLSFYDW